MASRVRSLIRPRYHEVLRNISFEIPPGESVALLGVNGCGKTTLLRLVCGVTHPTSGKVIVNGRAGGLIELTAGFHEEL
ncbi:MAG: ATP-binding cassette domain-containing protein, partial [Candidatus Sumerlaeaceae bacterium]